MKTPPDIRAPAPTPEAIDALLTRWATADRHPLIAEHVAIVAAERALASARVADIPEAANDRRWFPAALIGGGMAAAVAGVMFVGGQSPLSPSIPADSVELAAAEPAPVQREAAPQELAFASTSDGVVPGIPPAYIPPSDPMAADIAVSDIAVPDVEIPDMATAAAPAAPTPFGAPRRATDGGTRLAALNEELAAGGFSLDEPNDDLFMVGHVFTPRPEEEMFLP
ncbi:hypothetical protein KCG44_10895 [Pacificimonas sp. WHA3]|uniref:Uncharacterized protein n=1 Tax=Pacificimonas pallii TaxID=2827236 RepID=A0ABS6SFX9_9SPHN|nr:hypothetical protein [Pacificimonas pallii]MBV7257290.1 hypothetical protein [Pacificimonas pallii]